MVSCLSTRPNDYNEEDQEEMDSIASCNEEEVEDDDEGRGEEKQEKTTVPLPRYAFQVVYDSIQQSHYLFGGNPGSIDLSKESATIVSTSRTSLARLNDFWKLQWIRPTAESLLASCPFSIACPTF